MEESEKSHEALPEAKPAKGLIGSLLDFSFTSFVTPSIIKFLYSLSLIGTVLGTLGWIFSGGGFTSFLWRAITSPFVLVIGILLARFLVELVVIAFRILDLLQRIESNQRDAKVKD